MRSFLLLIFLLFVFVAADASEKSVVKCEGPVNAAVGENVTFPCSLQPPYNMRPARVEWRHNTTLVHRYRSGGDDNGDQDKKYKGRTFMFETELDKGNISLKLTNVTVNDAGHYTCRMAKPFSQDDIHLSVYLSVADPGSIVETDPRETPPIAEIIGTIIATIAVIVIFSVIIYCKRCRRAGQGQDPQNFQRVSPEEMPLQERGGEGAGQGQDPHINESPQVEMAPLKRGGSPGLREDQTEQTPAPATPEFNSNGVKKQSKHQPAQNLDN